MAIVSKDGSTIRRDAFYSAEVFKDEMERIFQHSWLYVGHVSEVAEPGDYVQRVLGADSVILTRDEDGELHVLQNSCRHRGAMLCSADSGNSSHFRCSYHGWTFGNDGALRGVPNTRELYTSNPLDRRAHSLVEARVGVIYGLIFANWDHDAPSLEESMGNAAWYLQAIFDKDLEVMGPPTRIVGKHNWKAGAENMTPDDYHGFVTHKTVFDLGIALSGDVAVAEAIKHGAGNFTPEEANPEKQVVQVLLDNGHSLAAYGGLKFEKPAFIGYEGHLWENFASRLTPEQIDFQDGQFASVGNIFPNFSWTEQLFSSVGTDNAGVKAVHVRLWLPLSPTETEQYSWVLVPKAASPEWKLDSQRAFVRCLGVGGMYEVDDLQNWTGMAQSGRGAVGRSTPNNMSAIVSEKTTTLNWAGDTYKAFLDDIGFRRFYSTWAQRMGFTEEDFEKSLIPDELAGRA